MADRSNGEIWIGGKIKRELVPGLCDLIRAENMTLGWFGDVFDAETAEELLECLDDECGVPVLYLCDDQAVDGQFYDLEEFLRQHGLPYTRHSAHCHYYDGSQAEYRPGHELVVVMTNTDGDPVITRVDEVERAWYLVKEAQQLLQLGKPALGPITQAADELARALPPELPPLEPFAIDDQSSKAFFVNG